MEVILSLETSTANCSVAIHQNGVLTSFLTTEIARSHAEKILQLVNEALENTQLNLSDVNAIAISAGPGSYTGLRIASSTAKGLCYALDIPLIAVNTLEALANAHLKESYVTCAMLDARRMEVYCAIFDDKGNEIEPTSAKIIDADSFSELLKDNRMLFCGDAVEKCQKVISSDNAIFIPNSMPSAAQIGAVAVRKFQSKLFVDTAYFEPFYLKEFVALNSTKPLF